MCITTAAAELSSTKIYAGTFQRGDKTLHTLLYQNNPENQDPGPNCMILPIPSATPMTPENLIDAPDSGRRLIEDLRTRLKPRTRSFSKGETSAASAGGTHVFDSGAYTVVLGQKVVEVRKALEQVSENKRPQIPISFFTFFRKQYPDWHLAICCFDNKHEMKADPLIWWYEPMDPNVVFAPGMDAHDGNPPVAEAEVGCDHEVMFGTTSTLAQGTRILLQGSYGALSEMVPLTATYHSFRGRHPNGDFFMSIGDLRSGRGRIQRGVV